MKEAKALTKIIHGSHLYGTNTLTSDNDFKGVHLPSALDILLGRSNNVKNFGVKKSFGVKNSKDDIDDSSYAVAKFLKLLVDGDTSGVEILLAPDRFRTSTSDEFEEIKSYKNRLLNKKTKGFVGYCKSQSAKYGIKGSRMTAAANAVVLLNQFNPSDKLGNYVVELASLMNNEHTDIKVITTPSGVNVSHLSICDKLSPFTHTVKNALDLYKSVYDNYGVRAQQAANNENVDWKAVSHAVRIGEEAIELLLTGDLEFPRSNSKYLLEVKLGLHPYVRVAENLEKILVDVEDASNKSILPEHSDETLIQDLIVKLHKSQIV